MFLNKNSVPIISHVDKGTAILTIGAGGGALVTDVAKNLGKTRKKSRSNKYIVKRRGKK